VVGLNWIPFGHERIVRHGPAAKVAKAVTPSSLRSQAALALDQGSARPGYWGDDWEKYHGSFGENEFQLSPDRPRCWGLSRSGRGYRAIPARRRSRWTAGVIPGVDG
jgi:hypothetical protein